MPSSRNSIDLNQSTVLFFDSGIGGFAYLREFAQRNRQVNTVYVADSEYFPYGDRSPIEVEERVALCFAALPHNIKIDVAVLACNTASVVALQRLRSEVDYPVVGVVPAVKPAAALTKTGHIAVLSTNRTAHDPYTRDLVRRFARYSRVTSLGLPNLVELAERSFCSDDSLIHEFREEVLPQVDASVDTVVLACTHFIRYRHTFERIFPSHVQVVDSLDGVVRRIEALLDGEAKADDRSRSQGSGDPPEPLVFLTGNRPLGLECLSGNANVQSLEVGVRG